MGEFAVVFARSQFCCNAMKRFLINVMLEEFSCEQTELLAKFSFGFR